MKYVKVMLEIVVVVIIIVLVVKNHEALSTSVVFKLNFSSINLETPRISLYAIIVFSFLLGILITGLYGIYERFHIKKELKTLKQAAMEKDEELSSLRNLPITSDNVGAEPDEEL